MSIVTIVSLVYGTHNASGKYNLVANYAICMKDKTIHTIW